LNRRYFLLAALLLTGLLFVGGGHPGTVIASEVWHDLAHVAALAAIAFAYSRGLPRLHWLWIVVLVAVLGGVHELSQKLTSAHDAELDDVLLDALGALLGAASARLTEFVGRRTQA
jgi:VanZ family protein